MAKTQPNILLLFCDQFRYDAIHAHGNQQMITPTLDRLVSEGASFNHAYTPSPVCVSARCGLVTGLAPHQSGVVDNMAMDPTRKSFMEGLKSQGYQTQGVGKMHFTPDSKKLWGFDKRAYSEEISGPGFHDDYMEFLKANSYEHVEEPHGIRSEYYYIPQPSQLPAHLHHTAWVADGSIKAIEERDPNRPFFLWSSFIKPHPPFESPAPWQKLYRTAEMHSPFRPEGFENQLNYWNRVQNRYKYRDAGRDEMLLRTMRAAYFGCISFIDFHLGRILASLGNDIEDTLVVFSSDHGELLGDFGSFGKRSMLKPACQVPLIIRLPGKASAGSKIETPATLLDLFPTFMEVAGRRENPSVEGESLLPFIKKPETKRVVYSQFSHKERGLYMATDGQYKFIYSSADRREWLYDLAQDPRETKNLAENAMHAQTVRRWRDQLIKRFTQAGYHDAVENGSFKLYPTPPFPLDPDGGLLFQDPGEHEEKTAALGPYARNNTVRGITASSILCGGK